MKKNIILLMTGALIAVVGMGLAVIGGRKYIEHSRRGHNFINLTDPHADADGTFRKCLESKRITYYVSPEGVISVDAVDEKRAIFGCS